MSQTSVQQEYAKAEALVRNMCTVRYPGKIEAEYQRHIRIFTEMLQGIMLYAVLDDRKVETAERDLIVATSVHGCVLDRINAQAKFENPAWVDLKAENLETVTLEQQETILRVLPPALEQAIQTFIYSFAEMDYAITTKDYFAELKDVIEKITVAAILSDGDDRQSPRAQKEYDASRRAFIELFKKKWEVHSPELFRFGE